MANKFEITNAVAQAIAQAVEDAIDAGTAAVIEIYTGTQPTEADAAVTGTLLATLTCSATAGVVSDAAPGGVITFSAITGDSSADDSGTAGYGVLKTQAAGTVVFMFSVSTTGADMNFDTVSFTAGSAVDITSITITFPEGP